MYHAASNVCKYDPNILKHSNEANLSIDSTQVFK